MLAKSKISDVLPKSFKAGRCKTSLKLAMARIKLLKNKREVLLKQMRRDLAQLLENGQEQIARIRVEHVIREEKTMSAYDLIEIYCELIVARLPIIESQKSCPIDLKESIASVVFASLRCADIPELTEIRKHLLAKYGKEFVNAALELRPECGVSRMVVEKLSARAPDVETKIKTLTSIAQEHNCEWDPNPFQEQIQKPNDDLLNGPTTFTSANMMQMEFSTVNPGQMNESVRKMSENEVTSKPDNFSALSHENVNTSSTSVPVTSRYSPETPENRCGGEEFKFSYSMEDSAINQPNWNMEFKDVTSAAQAAAESAKMASRAARVAAELASRGNVSRQNSSGSPESTVHGMTYVPGTSKGSMREGEHPVRESVTMEKSERKRFQGMKSEMHKPQVARASTMRDADYVYDGLETVSNISLGGSPSHSSTSPVNDDVSDVNLQKADLESFGYTPKTFSEAEYTVQHPKNAKVEHADDGWGNVNERKSASFHHADALDGDTIWDNPENAETGDSNAAVFDDSGSDTDHSMLGRYSRRNLLDSSLLQQRMEPWSPEQQKNKPQARSPFVTEPHPAEYSEATTKGTLSSQSTDNLPPAYDSDCPSSEDDDEMNQSTGTEAMKPSNLLHIHRGSTKGSPSAVSNRETTYFDRNKDVEGAKINSFSYFPDFNEKNHGEETSSFNKYSKSSGFSKSRNHLSPRYESSLDDSVRESDISLTEKEPESWRSPRVPSADKAETKDKFAMASSPSGIKDSEISNESYESGQGLNLGRLTGGFKTKGYLPPPYTRSPFVDASLPSKQPSDDSPSIIEKPPVVSKVDDSAARTEVPVQRRLRKDYKDSSFRTPVTNFNTDSSEQKQHTLRSRHCRDSSSSTLPEQGPDVSLITEKSTLSHPSKTLLSPKFPKQEIYDQKPHMKLYTESSSSIPVNYFDLCNDEEEDLESRHTVGRRGHTDAKLSPRTRDVTSEDKRGSLSRTADQAEMTAISDIKHKASRSSSHAAESISSTRTRARNFDGKGSSKALQPNSSAEQSSARPLKSESSMFKGNPKSPRHDSTQPLIPENDANSKMPSSSREMESISHGSSRKNASHVHPKLPDYDSLLAHFQSLRSNRG